MQCHKCKGINMLTDTQYHNSFCSSQKTSNGANTVIKVTQNKQLPLQNNLKMWLSYRNVVCS